jgi:hypothetical protein
MDEYVKKEDVLKIIYDIKENKDIPKNYGTLIDIIRQIRKLPSDEAIRLSEIKAVEEFAETLKEKSKYAKQIPAGEYFEAVDVEDINNLVKEKKGEE